MKKCSTLVAVIALTVLIGPLGAQANLVWDWTGDCDGNVSFPLPGQGGGTQGCAGKATLHVVTTDAYIPGEEVGAPSFTCTPTTCTPVSPLVLLQALYTDSMGVTFDFASVVNSINGFGFQIPDGLGSFEGHGYFESEAQGFISNANGTWRLDGEDLRPGCDIQANPICPYDPRGFNGVWTRVPEPSALVLLGVGLAGLASLRRRKVG